jgi:hypothetical protein
VDLSTDLAAPAEACAKTSTVEAISAILGFMETLEHTGSIVVTRSPEELYDMVSDVTRMGEWSPVCKVCWWDEGESAGVGAMFTGRNETPERTWETRSEVVVADRGREFAFVVQATGTRWGYRFAAVEDGTEITESWQFPPSGFEFFQQRFGDDADTQVANRHQAAREGIAATLAAIKKTAESAR